MEYKNKKTNNIYDFNIELYENIPVKESYDRTEGYFKVVEVWDCGVIVRRAMTKDDILIFSESYRFLISKSWFEENYERIN